MGKNRLEAFSDGVIAILITIMVLELKVPKGETIEALEPLTPVFLSYVLSFVYLGIYWNNHHHLFQAVERINGRVLWANLHLLFWLSLLPFATAWMGTTRFATWPVALYGAVLLLAAFAYYLLVHALLAVHEPGSTLATALGGDVKGRLSLALYLLALPLAFVSSGMASAIYFLVAAMWLAPDPRIEKRMAE
ncbi:MAG: TMEM175 family protein [Acidobacteriota bacterium]